MKHPEPILIVLLIVAAFFSACNGPNVQQPFASKGKLVLKTWNFAKDGPVNLDGEYEFYWQRHIPPAAFSDSKFRIDKNYVTVPNVWNNYVIDAQQLPGAGYATFRLRLEINSLTSRELAFKFLDMGTTFIAFANGDTLLAMGKPGIDKATSQARYLPQIVEFTPASNRIELVFHVSNFHHRRGGIWETIKFGTKEQLVALRERRIATDLILFGAILIMGFYHLALFLLRKEDKSTLIFAIFNLLIAIRMLTTVERILQQTIPNMPWELFVKVEYLSYLLAVPLFGLFTYYLFPQDIHKTVVKVLFVGFSILSLIILFTPARVGTHVLLPSQVMMISILLYAITILILCIKRQRKDAWIFLAGFLCLAATVINDILDASGYIATGHYVHAGVFIFIFSQSFILSSRFAKTFKTMDRQKNELASEISERKQVEKKSRELREKLARSQKMEAVGLLAGGVAHDLNNILTGIVSYPDLLLSELPRDSDLKEPLQTIREAGNRATAVVQDLLTLARKGVIHFEPVNLNDIVRNYLISPEHKKLLRDHPGLSVHQKLDPGLLNIQGSAVHILRTLANLVWNSAEAQPKGGDILIKTKNRYIDKPRHGYEDIPIGDYAVLSVKDKGIGIDADDLEKIFEPFYTKKVLGRSGTGLGMAVVWGTVHDHHGYIDIKTGLGSGATFNLYFEITTDAIEESSSHLPLEEYVGNSERVLVVDDIQQQREIATRILKKLGYSVVVVASGEDAIKFIQKNDADLLLLDMIMDPGIDGLETFKEIKKLAPEIKAVIASGYSETERVKHAQELGAGVYVRKPYTLEKIGRAIRAELDRKNKQA